MTLKKIKKNKKIMSLLSKTTDVFERNILIGSLITGKQTVDEIFKELDKDENKKMEFMSLFEGITS
jgi:hypothetical protein